MERKKPGRPKVSQLRSEKIVTALDAETFKNFKALSAIEDISMSDKILGYILADIEKRQPEIQAFRKIQESLA